MITASSSEDDDEAQPSEPPEQSSDFDESSEGETSDESDSEEAEEAWTKSEALLAAEHREMVLEELVWRGVPRRRRRQEWLRLSGADALAQREGFASATSLPWTLLGTAEELAEKVPAAIRADIEVDVPRSGVSARHASRGSLRRILLAVAARNPTKLGYCQGLNVIAATTLGALRTPTSNLLQDEAATYWLLAVLTEERCEGWWNSDLASLRRDVDDLAQRLVQQREKTWFGSYFFSSSDDDDDVEEVVVRPSPSFSERNPPDIAPPASRARMAARRLEDVGAPFDLLITQWLLTVFGHAGGRLAPKKLRLRALDVAYCAPAASTAAFGKRPGAGALLAVALAVVAAADLKNDKDLVDAARSLEGVLVSPMMTDLFKAAHSLAGDATLLTSSLETTKPEVDKLRRPLSATSFWLEAATRVASSAVAPLETAVASAAPSLAADLKEAADRANALVDAADQPPLAVVITDKRNLKAALRFLDHILGQPLTTSSKSLVPGDLPSKLLVVFIEWGDDDDGSDDNDHSDDDDDDVRVSVCRVSRPALRRFSVALVVVIEMTAEEEEPIDSEDDNGPQTRRREVLARLRGDALFIVVDLDDAKESLAALARMYAELRTDDDDLRYVLVAGPRVAKTGLEGVLPAVGRALYRASLAEGQIPDLAHRQPDFFIVGPLDAEVKVQLAGTAPPVVRFARTVLLKDERRLLRVFAALPRARALAAVEAVLVRARSAQFVVCAIQAVVDHTRWWRRPLRPLRRWWWSRRDDDDDDEARRVLASLDAAQIRELSADNTLALKVCKAALVDLDRRVWGQVSSCVLLLFLYKITSQATSCGCPRQRRRRRTPRHAPVGRGSLARR